MTSTMTSDGSSLHFPGILTIDDQGMIIPPPADTLPAIAQAVADEQLMLFIKRLVASARKRRRQPRHAALNRSNLQLDLLCIDRALANQQLAAPPTV